MTPGATFVLWSIPVLVPLLSSSPARAAEQPPFLPGTILTVAGTPGKAGFSGDGGPATQAKLNNPFGLAVDAAGDLFIGDAYNACVRRVSPDGTITTVAGIGGHSGFSGDGGPATKARLAEALDLVTDAAGDLFLCDFDNNRVRKVDSSGMITTVAGTGAAGFSGDGGPATAARLKIPTGLALDRDGNLFIVDWGNQRIRKVDAAGIITTVAGGGHPPDGRGDGGLATEARLVFPPRVAVDSTGGLYIVEPAANRVRRVSPDGNITTVAGGGNPTDGVGDGGPATEARLDSPNCIALDAGDNLFIGENNGERIRKVSPAGIIATVAGSGQIGHTGDGGPALAASLNSPTALCIDRAGNLYFAEGNRYLQDANGKVAVAKVGNMVVREVIGVAVPR